jgi:hypothetical protein
MQNLINEIIILGAHIEVKSEGVYQMQYNSRFHGEITTGGKAIQAPKTKRPSLTEEHKMKISKSVKEKLKRDKEQQFNQLFKE